MASVSVPSRTTNWPVWAVSAAGRARATNATMVRMDLSVDSERLTSRESISLRRSGRSCSPRLPLAHLSEHGVDAVEVRLWGVADEKLAAPRVLAGVGHGEGARDVLVDVLVRLARDRVARPAGADPSLAGLGVGIAALDREVGDHAMEPGSVVEPGVGELLEVGDRARRLVGEQVYFDAAFNGLEYGLLVRHQLCTE